MATYTEQAQNYASQKAKEYENSLGYLVGNVNSANEAAKQSLTADYNNLVNTLNNNYASDAKSAYVNKMLTGESLNETLANLGVSTQGFGLSQRLANETNYGSNLANLQNALGQNLSDASANYQSQLAQQQANYLSQLNDVQSQIASISRSVYNQALSDYENIYAEQQAQNKNDIFSNLLNTINSQGAGYYSKAEAYDSQRGFGDTIKNAWNDLTGLVTGKGWNSYVGANQSYNNWLKDYSKWSDDMATELYNNQLLGNISKEQSDKLLQLVSSYNYKTNKKK